MPVCKDLNIAMFPEALNLNVLDERKIPSRPQMCYVSNMSMTSGWYVTLLVWYTYGWHTTFYEHWNDVTLCHVSDKIRRCVANHNDQPGLHSMINQVNSTTFNSLCTTRVRFYWLRERTLVLRCWAATTGCCMVFFCPASCPRTLQHCKQLQARKKKVFCCPLWLPDINLSSFIAGLSCWRRGFAWHPSSTAVAIFRNMIASKSCQSITSPKAAMKPRRLCHYDIAEIYMMSKHSVNFIFFFF